MGARSPEGNTGSGTSLLETVQQLGSVLGVAGLGSLLGYGYLGRLHTAGLPGAAADAARDSVSGADAVARPAARPSPRGPGPRGLRAAA
ncbi:hypothetical protein GCM10017687_29590 [Streptomyces echinatus]|uniref:hypothetical protein n=1 Tax=Streptomyces echinatus TaxID=67293 RepID=UPI0031E6D809